MKEDNDTMTRLEHLFRKINTPEGKEEILGAFSAIDQDDPLQADFFFEKYGGWIWRPDPQTMPYSRRDHIGRVSAYLDLLDLIRQHDAEKFQRIHKGTPYCILGWLLIDIQDYERGVFYMDAAISEDVRTDPHGWENRPAARFMFLEALEKDNTVAKRIITRVRSSIADELKQFNSHFDKPLTVESLVQDFVRPKIQAVSHRTLICSFNIFILEAPDRIDLLKRRSADRGSVEPFLTHLHKGSVILESILKEIYTSLSGSTLGQILNDPFVKKDLKFSLYQTGSIGRTLEDLVQHVVPHIEKENVQPPDRWLTLSYRLRNVTSHSLLWPDVFDEETHRKLYHQILFAILYVIKQKYG